MKLFEIYQPYKHLKALVAENNQNMKMVVQHLAAEPIPDEHWYFEELYPLDIALKKLANLIKDSKGDNSVAFLRFDFSDALPYNDSNGNKYYDLILVAQMWTIKPEYITQAQKIAKRQNTLYKNALELRNQIKDSIPIWPEEIRDQDLSGLWDEDEDF